MEEPKIAFEQAGDAPAPRRPLTSEEKARMVLMPSVVGPAVIRAYQKDILGTGADVNVMGERLRETFAKIRGGNMDQLEAMLISQATALQTIFTSLAIQAQKMDSDRNFESCLGLALKAQAQSRATITALADLKHPRQATFVNQANIANGPQQVNNCATTEVLDADKRTGGPESRQNKLLESDHGQPGKRMDTGTAQASKRGHSAMATVGKVHRPQERKR